VSRRDRSGNEQNVDEATNQEAQAEVSLEKHYSVNEVSKLWGMSVKTVRTLFKREPGVVEFGNGESRFKRVYVTRRIPESVVKRVHRRLRRTA
jgi:hypothetical protein